MCSRYELNASSREVAARFGLILPLPMPNRAEMRPTDAALVIGPTGPRLARWGLEVAWDKRPVINARAETLDKRAAFKRLLGQRVLIPASAWWEWRAVGKGKIKMRLRPEAGGVFAFAGLADGDRFTLVTRAAAPSLAAIHDRMPAIVPAAAEADWLDPARPFTDIAVALASPPDSYRAEEECHPAPPDLFS